MAGARSSANGFEPNRVRSASHPAIMPGTVTLHTPFCGMRPLAAFDRTRSAVTPEAAHPLAFSPYTVPDFAS